MSNNLEVLSKKNNFNSTVCLVLLNWKAPQNIVNQEEIKPTQIDAQD